MQHEVLTQRAAEPCQQVMMLSTTMRTDGPLVSLSEHPQRLLQTGRLCLIHVFVSHKTNISPNKIFVSP